MLLEFHPLPWAGQLLVAQLSCLPQSMLGTLWLQLELHEDIQCCSPSRQLTVHLLDEKMHSDLTNALAERHFSWDFIF